MSNPEASRTRPHFNSSLSVWHKLLIYYLVEKNRIIKSLVDMDYVNAEDIKEIKTWSDWKIKKSLNSISEHSSDYDNCPWCTHYNKLYCFNECKGCGYGERHGGCIEEEMNGSHYRALLHTARVAGLTVLKSDFFNADLSTIPAVNNLSMEVRIVFTVLSKINFLIIPY